MVECETDNFVIEVQLFFSIPMAIYGGKDNWKSSVLQKLDTLVRFQVAVPICSCNSTGRVPALHAEGYRFESYHEYQIKDTHSNTLTDKILTSC